MRNLIKIKDITVYRDENYNTFPNVLVKQDGTIYAAFRQATDWQKVFTDAPDRNFGRITHVDPSSKAVYVTSKDGGSTWDSKAKILYDDFVYGVQDPCINLLKDGSIFCTFFMWKVFKKCDVPELLPGDRLLSSSLVGRVDGAYSIRSIDGGLTWDMPVPVNCPADMRVSVRGNTAELEDGTILLPAYGAVSNGGPSRCILLATTNRGKSWEYRSEIACIESHDLVEPNLYRTCSGKLVAFIRSHMRGGKSVYDPGSTCMSPLFTCESHDDGRTWGMPVQRNFYSPSPFHALRLKSGNVLVSYGYRYKPFGLRAFLLDSECSSFDDADDIVLRDDGLGTDIGYTSAVQTENGDILITYYYYDEENGERYIAGTVCREKQAQAGYNQASRV